MNLRSKSRWPGALLAIWLAGAGALTSARGECVTNTPLPGVVCILETRKEPPQRLYAAIIDLSRPGARVRVAPGGPDPDGSGPWQTTLMTPTRIGEREAFDVVVNGDFFHLPPRTVDGVPSRMREQRWAAVLGPAVSDGKVWSTSKQPLPCLVVEKQPLGRSGQSPAERARREEKQQQRVSIQNVSRPSAKLWQVIAGNTMLVVDGAAVPNTNKVRHPRTVAGIDAAGKRLVLLVVDGRRPNVALGMNYDELAAEMLRLGCWQALNLDGGGSSMLAIRDRSSGRLRILNEPTDGQERAVANALGVRLDRD